LGERLRSLEWGRDRQSWVSSWDGMGVLRRGPVCPDDLSYSWLREKCQPGTHSALGRSGGTPPASKAAEGRGSQPSCPLRCSPQHLMYPAPHCSDLPFLTALTFPFSRGGRRKPLLLPLTAAGSSPPPTHCSNLFPIPPSHWLLPLASGSTPLSLLSFSFLSFHPRRS
jgi:hypothetical protein